MVDKNRKPVDNIEQIKRIRATINRNLEPVEEIKYTPADLRDPVFHRTVWAWIKQKVLSPAGNYVDSKINLAVETGVKTLIFKYGWIILLIVFGAIAAFKLL